MNNKTTRAMQSKISLKLPLASAELSRDKVKMKPNIKQSIIDDFEKAYKMNCNQEKQRTKNRNVSYDSVFDPQNKPPKELFQNEPKILEKIGKFDIRDVKANKLPLAGRLTEIGEQILLIGS